MPGRAEKPPKLTLTFHLGLATDLEALDPTEREAARVVLDDLTYGRVTGRALGTRHVSGNLTGFARVRFDVPGREPRSLRLVYRLIDAETAEVFVIGRRDDHAVYRLAVDRLDRE